MEKLTLNEYFLRIKGIQLDKEQQLHNTRLIMHSILTPHLRRGRKLELKDIIKLSFDDVKPSVRLQSRDEYLRETSKIIARKWQVNSN